MRRSGPMDHGLALMLIWLGLPGLAWGDLPIREIVRWKIVIAAQADPAERYAATELRQLLGEATGQELTVISDDDPPTSVIRIGTATKLETGAMGPEDFVPHVRDHLRLIHDAAQASQLHNDCYGLAAEYGISAPTARQAILILDHALEAADDDTVRNRVRKLMLAPRTVLIDPFAKWLGQHFVELRDGKLKSVPAEAYAGLEDDLENYLALCRELDVDRVSEWTTTAQFQALLGNRE